MAQVRLVGYKGYLGVGLTGLGIIAVYLFVVYLLDLIGRAAQL